MLKRKPAKLLTLALVLTSLSGCTLPAGGKSTAVKSPNVDAHPLLKGLALCKSELQALQGYNATSFAAHKKSFDSAQEKASQYLVVRPTLSPDVQILMDSIHQTQMARQCQQIHADLFSAMIARADGE